MKRSLFTLPKSGNSRALATVLLSLALLAPAARAEPAKKPPPVDLLTFAAGALPVEVRGSGAALGAGFEQAVGAIDGSTQGFTLTRKFASPDTWVEFVYRLPAATTFERFTVPNVFETPSPNQTFTRRIEIQGSPTSPSAGLVRLAEATLSVPAKAGEATELTMKKRTPVTYLVVRLSGGIETGAKFFEFSELVGNGSQAAVPMSNAFTGAWKPRGSDLNLTQNGSTVTGCLDRGRKALTGTVTGNLLRATFVDGSSRTQGALIAAIDENGVVFGLRSDNGGPFHMLTGPRAEGGASQCPPSAKATLGCGSIVHGIEFAFDSAKLLPEAEPILRDLAAALKSDPAPRIEIEGHTSSEGSESYNLDLSKRRAAAVVEALVKQGVAASRLRGVGRGEADPIAPETTEAGRSLNRRVEIECKP